MFKSIVLLCLLGLTACTFGTPKIQCGTPHSEVTVRVGDKVTVTTGFYENCSGLAAYYSKLFPDVPGTLKLERVQCLGWELDSIIVRDGQFEVTND